MSSKEKMYTLTPFLIASPSSSLIRLNSLLHNEREISFFALEIKLFALNIKLSNPLMLKINSLSFSSIDASLSFSFAINKLY